MGMVFERYRCFKEHTNVVEIMAEDVTGIWE